MPDRLAAIRRGEIREPPQSTVPRWLRPLLLKGLSGQPGDRWPGMRALLTALARDPERERARRRRTALLVVAVLVLGGALVYAGTALWSYYREQTREAAVQLDLDATLARLASLRAEGRKVEADAVVDAFVADPEHVGTGAQVHALRWRAEQRRGGGDIDGALEAYSEAYAATRDPNQAGEVAIMEMSYGGSFALRLHPDAPGAAPLEVSAYRSGTTGATTAQLFMRLGSADPVFAIPLPGPGDRLTLELRPEVGAGRAAPDPERPYRAVRRPCAQFRAFGDLHLEFDCHIEWPGPLVIPTPVLP